MKVWLKGTGKNVRKKQVFLKKYPFNMKNHKEQRTLT